MIRDARSRFKVGDRVKISDEGMRNLQFSMHRVGTVTGFGHDTEVVRVRKDGNKTSSAYHFTFWKKIYPKKGEGDVSVSR